MKLDYVKLSDYNRLAYEFAIRNQRVIELLAKPLTISIVNELLTFGIDATSIHFDETGNEIVIYSLQELYLDYHHLAHINHIPYNPYSMGQENQNEDTLEYDEYRGEQFLIHPRSKNFFYIDTESEQDALNRMKDLIESRGKSGGKFERLINGKAFEHYDAVIFFDETVYSIDPSTNTKKTIKTDIKLITEWVKPENYLQLIKQ